MNIFWEIFIVLTLTVLNGFFACSEIALISVRKTRIANLAKQGNRRAQIIQNLKNDPELLFATIQIGISLITITAAAFAGSKLAKDLSDYLSHFHLGPLRNYIYEVTFVLVVGAGTYVNLVIGELVPKSLGLRYAENFSLLAAYPIWWLSKISSGLIKLLKFSSNIILKPFKDSTEFTESLLSSEELRSLLNESKKAGTIDPHEHNIIDNVFESSRLSVGKIMVPRTRIVAFNIKTPVQEIIRLAIESGYSRVPVYQATLNHVVGILYTKKLLPKLEEGFASVKLEDFLVAPYFVPNTMKIDDVLQKLQKKKAHMALVTDEHGEIEGLVTLEDVLEEIVGDITDETDEISKAIMKQDDGSFVVSGEISIVDFNKFFKSELPENADYSTLSGFILDKLGRFPDVGDTLTEGNMEIVVKETTLRTVKTIAIKIK